MGEVSELSGIENVGRYKNMSKMKLFYFLVSSL